MPPNHEEDGLLQQRHPGNYADNVSAAVRGRGAAVRGRGAAVRGRGAAVRGRGAAVRGRGAAAYLIPYLELLSKKQNERKNGSSSKETRSFVHLMSHATCVASVLTHSFVGPLVFTWRTGPSP